MKEILQVAIQMQHHAIYPSLACISYLGTIDIKLEDIIVRILHVQVLLQLLGSKLHLSADVYITAGLTPAAADILSLATPGSLLGLPTAGIKAFLLPTLGWSLAGYLTFPTLLIRHRSNGREHVVLFGTHKAIGFAVNTQKTQERLLVVGPVTGGTVS